VKNFAKLTIFFSLSFVITFIAASVIRFLSLHVEWAGNLPPKPETALTLLIAAAHWALTMALFFSILLSLSYAARRSYSAPFTVLYVMALSLVFCFVFSLALERWNSVPPAQSVGISLGDKGLILSNSLNRNETAVVLLKGTAEPLGPRVTAIPGQPLVFHESASANFDLPPVPFGDVTPWFLKSIYIDVRLNAEMFQKKFVEGFVPFFIYIGSLIILLCSLGFAIKFSAWPIANLFIGIIAFRGVLALHTFLYSPEIQDILDSFFKNLMPVQLAVPLLFTGFGVMVHFYSLLVYVVRRRDRDGN